MAYASDSDLTTRIPATLAASSDLRLLALADAEEEIDDLRFAGRAVRAHCLLAAHILAMNPESGVSGGAAGVVQSQAAGEISVSYAVGADAVGGLHSETVYGREFDRICAGIIGVPEAV